MRTTRDAASELLAFIDASPTPWHACRSVEDRLKQAGFQRLKETDDWQLKPDMAAYVVRDGSSIIAFRLGEPSQGMRIVGAHTDSPGLRIKPQGAFSRAGLINLGVEIYGGPILATFADRDLTLAGRVLTRGSAGNLESHLIDFERPLLRLPNLAIHLNREVNEQGLRFDPQEELPLVLGSIAEQVPAEQELYQLLAEALQVEPEAILSWDLAAVDVQPGAFFGKNEEFIASGRIDNLASCHAGLEALLNSAPQGSTQVLALFDHEEVGSESYKGADGTFLQDTIVRISTALGCERASDRRRLAARSVLISADMAHALHPSFMRYYEPQHSVRLNGGPVIKINVKQRYATDAVGEAYFSWLCQEVDVPHQKYVHRNNLPCGSTIGPISAARLGIRTIDVGNPMWAMHSARESAGTHDHDMMIKVLTRFYGDTTQLHG